MDSISRTPNIIQNRRKSQVFVEIPPSPLFMKRVVSTSAKVDNHPLSHASHSHKENTTPLLPKTQMNNIPREKKRKAVDDVGDIMKPDTKKAKPMRDETGFIACHQCRSKKAPAVMLQCTRLRDSGTQCKASYCETCLKNRYGENLHLIKQKKPSDPKQKERGLQYVFNCPRCEGHCNCAPCRKKLGLAPVGKIALLDGQGSVHDILKKDPNASGLLPKNSAHSAENISPKASNSTETILVKSDKTNSQKKTPQQAERKEVIKKPKKDVPEPVWVPVPDMGSKEDVENRIFLREFILRFNPILDISLSNVDELEDFSSLHDQSAKAILMALLDLVAVEDKSHKKTIQASLKTIRSLGLNWSKIFPVIFDLRDSLPRDHTLRKIPSLRESVMETSYNTRGGRMQGVHVDQLLPVLLFLVEAVMESESIRAELEEGTKQARDARTNYHKLFKEETERWAAEKAVLMEEKPTGEKEKTKKPDPWRIKYREAESKHKEAVANLQNMYKAEMDSCSSRFVPLGYDMQGRTYYALSASGPQKGKKDRIPSESERAGTKRWGWFLAVYGKPGTIVKSLDPEDMDVDSDDEEEDPNADRWWGFADVDEMRKLSKWLAHKGETDGASVESTPQTSTAVSGRAVSLARSLTPLSELEEGLGSVGGDETRSPRLPRASEMKELAKSIMEFADFIDWRLKRDSNGTKN